VSALPKSIPTILITACPNDSVRARALKAGVIGYLLKPFSEDDLLNTIRSALDQEGEAGSAPFVDDFGGAAPPARPVWPIGHQAAASRLGLETAILEIRRAEDIAPAFEALKGRAEALA
jgi:DNA-binding response OmpR family regulator